MCITFINKNNKIRHGIHHVQYYIVTNKLRKYSKHEESNK